MRFVVLNLVDVSPPLWTLVENVLQITIMLSSSETVKNVHTDVMFGSVVVHCVAFTTTTSNVALYYELYFWL